MIFDTSDIVFTLSSIFNILIFHNLFSIIASNQQNINKDSCILYIIYAICYNIVYYYISIFIVILLVIWIVLIRISLLYQEQLKSNIFIVTIISFIIATSDYLIFSVLDNNITKCYCYIIIRFLIYTFSIIIKEIFMPNNFTKPKSFFVIPLLIALVSFFADLILISDSSISDTKISIFIALMYFINFAVTFQNEMLLLNYTKNIYYTILEKENVLYNQQCKLMKNTTQNIQSFKHDLNNQLITLYELISNQNIKQAKELLSSLTEQTKLKQLYSTTGYFPIDSIINYKLQFAEQDKINIKTQISIPSEINIEITDIITVLGNLLDNALKAVKLLSDNQRYINIKISYTQGRLVIRIKNPYFDKIKLENNQIISTQKDSNIHGYGLKNVNKIADKYNGIMITDYKNHIFTVDVLLYLDD